MAAEGVVRGRGRGRRCGGGLVGWVACLLTLVVWFGGSAASAQGRPVYGWSDDPKGTPRVSDLSPNVTGAPYFENWDLWFHADDGTLVIAQFLTSSFGYGIERQGSTRVIVVEPEAFNDGRDGTPGVFRGDRGFNGKKGDWGWEKGDGFHVWFRDMYFRGDGTTFELFTRSKDQTVRFEATMQVEVPLWQPGDGQLEYGWDRAGRYRKQVLPRFSFEGRLDTRTSADAAESWRPLRGVGTFQHARTNLFPYDLAQRWSRFRALRSDGLTILFEELRIREEDGGGSIGWLLVALDDRVIFESDDVTFRPTSFIDATSEGAPYRVPVSWEILAIAGDDQVRIVSDRSHLVSMENPLRNLSRLLKNFLSSMMRPHDFDLTSPYAAEIRIGGDVARVSGWGWSGYGFTR